MSQENSRTVATGFQPTQDDPPSGNNKPYSTEEVDLLIRLKNSGRSWAMICDEFNNQVPPDRQRTIPGVKSRLSHLRQIQPQHQPAVADTMETLQDDPVPILPSPNINETLLPGPMSSLPPGFSETLQHEPMPMPFPQPNISETLQHEPTPMPFPQPNSVSLPSGPVPMALLCEPLPTSLPGNEAALPTTQGEALLPPYGSGLSWPSLLTGTLMEGSDFSSSSHTNSDLGNL